MIDIKAEKKVRKEFGKLIEDVEALLKDSPIHKSRGEYKTKLSNLINAAKTSSCLKQIELFVQYQAAREKDFREVNFATNLLKRLDPTKGIIATTIREITEGDQDELQIWTTVQYLGFLRKKYMFNKEMSKN